MDRTDLQHDAFQINGTYLEDVISGYITAKAAGRESLDKQVTTYDNGTDGAVIQRTRFPARTIEITFVLTGTSLADMRDKMHQLQTRLNVQGAEIIFNDDPNSYYIATPVMQNTVNEAKNTAYGTYNLLCYDPFKYSKTLTTVQTTSKTETVTDESGTSSSVTSTVLTTDNSGGYKTFPTFTVQFATDESASGAVGSNADCGYVLFAKGGTNYSVQIGDDQEKDTGTVTDVSHDFTSGANGVFTANNSISPFKSNLSYNGSVKTTSKGLMINSATTVAKKFHGPFAVYTLANPAANEFTLEWQHVFACSKTTATAKKQSGAIWIALLDSSNNVKLAYGLEKSSTTNQNAKEYTYDYNAGLGPARTVDVSYTGVNGYEDSFDTSGRRSTISMKRYLDYDDDNNVVGATTVVHTAEGFDYGIQESSPATIAKIAVFFGNYASNAAMYSNRLTKLTFINGNVDLVNSFGSGDVAVVDCGKAEISLNNKLTPNLGDAGNNWEDMYLDVGTNTIYVQWSEWVNASFLPTVTMTYRKRWL